MTHLHNCIKIMTLIDIPLRCLYLQLKMETVCVRNRFEAQKKKRLHLMLEYLEYQITLPVDYRE